jgi:hypothetical protein
MAARTQTQGITGHEQGERAAIRRGARRELQRVPLPPERRKARVAAKLCAPGHRASGNSRLRAILLNFWAF